VIEDRTRPSDIGLVQLSRKAVDLLPGWYEDWVVFERERIRQRLLHALESLSRRLVKLARFADAVEVAMTAVSLEPLRESAQRVLIEAHVAEGNQVEARRAFTAYERLDGCELGITPSGELASVLGATPSLRTPRPAPGRRAGTA
jgi:DNA-binding SARP family transcriptional activator